MAHPPFQTLGLDIGTNSLGWALVSNNADGEADSLVDCGVRIFQEAVDAKTREPKNRARRSARMARRILARRKQRKTKLRNFLIRHSLLPSELSMHSQPEILLNALDRLDGSPLGNPYLLRKKGLDEPLTAHQLGRVLMHLCARRGFQSNRKSLLVGELAKEYDDLAEAAEKLEQDTGKRDKKDEEDLGKVKAEIEGFWREINDAGCRTLGEYLAGIPELERKRRRHTDRKMFKEEFEKLWDSQARFHPQLRSDAFKADVFEIIFFQRPLKSQKGKVGVCTLEPKRKRAMRGRLDVQEYLLWQDLNHLECLDPETRRWNRLTQEQRQTLFDILQRQKTLSWAKAKKAIGVKETQTVKFNLEESKGKLTGNRVVCDLREVLPDKWDAYTPDQQRTLVEDLLTITDKNALLGRLKEHWAFPREQAYKLATLELPPGYVSLSVKAINKLLPHLRKGLIYSDARTSAGYGYDKKPGTALSLLPEPPDVRNPVVMKALYEVRKVINALIKTYGKPEVIRVEMARDMVVPRAKRIEQDKQRKENEKLNAEAEEKFKSIFPSGHASRDDKIKYRLAQECGWICPYTGKSISMTSLFTSGQWDIEHILPYSRTLDDSYMNKTLCDAEFNRLHKKGQTPWEVFGEGQKAPEWEQILQRIKSLPQSKQRKFVQKELGPIEDFITRQLNDTRHIAVAVKNYLACLGVDVQFTRGSMTADLRYHWGLNSLLSDRDEKERKDHRHHALDAIVIALTTRSLYMALHMDAQRREQVKTMTSPKQPRFQVRQPWDSFRPDVEKALARIIVSHAASRKLSGGLHEDTAYGLIQRDGENVFVYRKPLDGTFKNADDIIDPVVRERVKQRLAEFGGDAKKAFADLEQNPIYLNPDANHPHKRIPIKKVRIAASKVSGDSVFGLKNRKGDTYKYLKYGNNSHVELIENVQTGKKEGRFVTTLEAARRVRLLKQPMVQRNHGENYRFLTSLAVNDMVRIDGRNGSDIYRVQLLAATNNNIRFRHHLAAQLDDASQGLSATPTSFFDKGGEKISVDPLGRLTPARD
jgi:CRISPR-associated endonuclease Csn1